MRSFVALGLFVLLAMGFGCQAVEEEDPPCDAPLGATPIDVRDYQVPEGCMPQYTSEWHVSESPIVDAAGLAAVLRCFEGEDAGATTDDGGQLIPEDSLNIDFSTEMLVAQVFPETNEVRQHYAVETDAKLEIGVRTDRGSCGGNPPEDYGALWVVAKSEKPVNVRQCPSSASSCGFTLFPIP